MRLAEIHERTHLPLERLRYVLDNEIIKGLDRASEGRGTPRDFSRGDSMLIALAAALLANGVGAPFVRKLVGGLASDKLGEVIAEPASRDDIQIIEIAELFYARLLTNVNPPSNPPRWFDTRTKVALDPGYRPLTVVSVDTVELRRRLFGWEVPASK